MVGEPEVDVALLKLGTVRVVVCRPVYGNQRLVDGGPDAREPLKHAVDRGLKLIV